ncbi:hypothetical protein AB4Z19_21845 [Pseudoduganella sp. RAF19]|uniref:hypothetical protein n=1 Tax=Pseudoduganella sp. RAF19 TaxID=3233052 RepID=UPI003F94EEA2
MPKWLTGISLRESGKSVVFEIADAETGKADVVIEGEKLGDISSKSRHGHE